MNRRAQFRADRGGPTADAPADETLRVLTATGEDGRPRLALLNYACHGVCLMGDNRQISGDYPGLGCAELEHRVGGNCVALLLNGPAGDIDPRPSSTTPTQRPAKPACSWPTPPGRCWPAGF